MRHWGTAKIPQQPLFSWEQKVQYERQGDSGNARSPGNEKAPGFQLQRNCCKFIERKIQVVVSISSHIDQGLSNDWIYEYSAIENSQYNPK